MKELLTLATTGTTAATLLTGAGNECRLVGAILNCGGMSIGESATLTFRKGNDQFHVAASGVLTSNESQVFFGLTAEAIQILPSVIDPVTGAVQYNEPNTFQTGCLPNIWWPYDISIEPETGSGTCISVVWLYERRRAFAVRKGYPSLRDAP